MSTVPTGNNPELILASPASVTLRSVSSRTGSVSLDRSRGVAQQCVPPSQKCGSFVLGVPPPTTCTASPMGMTCQPLGVSPSSESSNELGKRAAVSSSIPNGCRPSILARTGSKSTNQDLKSARAISSSVAFIRRFNSILCSKACKICTSKALASSNLGTVKERKSSRDSDKLVVPLARERQ